MTSKEEEVRPFFTQQEWVWLSAQQEFRAALAAPESPKWRIDAVRTAVRLIEKHARPDFNRGVS
jgi:hypothetical protein